MTRETGDMRVLVVIGAVIGLLIVPLTASDLPLWQVLGVSIAIGAALGLATGFVIWMWRRPGRVRYGVAVSPMPIAAQTASFDNVTRPRDGGPYPCPCCGCVTLPERGGYELCPVCFWEDDGQDDHDADQVRGGPNGSLSLTEARRSFSRIGAVEERLFPYVRPPTDGERPR